MLNSVVKFCEELRLCLDLMLDISMLKCSSIQHICKFKRAKVTKNESDQLDSNQRPSDLQSAAIPLSYDRLLCSSENIYPHVTSQCGGNTPVTKRLDKV